MKKQKIRGSAGWPQHFEVRRPDGTLSRRRLRRGTPTLLLTAIRLVTLGWRLEIRRHRVGRSGDAEMKRRGLTFSPSFHRRYRKLCRDALKWERLESSYQAILKELLVRKWAVRRSKRPPTPYPGASGRVQGGA